MKTAIAIIVLIVLVAGGYLLFANKTQAPVQNPETMNTGTSAPVETTNPNGTGSAAAGTGTAPAQTVTVTYTDTGYSPKNITVAPGTTVTFVNNSSRNVWTASDVHPSHAQYDGTTLQQHCGSGSSFDECKPAAAGTSYSFTFTKAGTFGYHNHVKANDTGTVVVK